MPFRRFLGSLFVLTCLTRPALAITGGQAVGDDDPYPDVGALVDLNLASDEERFRSQGDLLCTANLLKDYPGCGITARHCVWGDNALFSSRLNRRVFVTGTDLKKWKQKGNVLRATTPEASGVEQDVALFWIGEGESVPKAAKLRLSTDTRAPTEGTEAIIQGYGPNPKPEYLKFQGITKTVTPTADDLRVIGTYFTNFATALFTVGNTEVDMKMMAQGHPGDSGHALIVKDEIVGIFSANRVDEDGVIAELKARIEKMKKDDPTNPLLKDGAYWMNEKTILLAKSATLGVYAPIYKNLEWLQNTAKTFCKSDYVEPHYLQVEPRDELGKVKVKVGNKSGECVNPLRDSACNHEVGGEVQVELEGVPGEQGRSVRWFGECPCEKGTRDEICKFTTPKRETGKAPMYYTCRAAFPMPKKKKVSLELAPGQAALTYGGSPVLQIQSSDNAYCWVMGTDGSYWSGYAEAEAWIVFSASEVYSRQVTYQGACSLTDNAETLSSEPVSVSVSGWPEVKLSAESTEIGYDEEPRLSMTGGRPGMYCYVQSSLGFYTHGSLDAEGTWSFYGPAQQHRNVTYRGSCNDMSANWFEANPVTVNVSSFPQPRLIVEGTASYGSPLSLKIVGVASSLYCWVSSSYSDYWWETVEATEFDVISLKTGPLLDRIVTFQGGCGDSAANYFELAPVTVTVNVSSFPTPRLSITPPASPGGSATLTLTGVSASMYCWIQSSRGEYWWAMGSPAGGPMTFQTWPLYDETPSYYGYCNDIRGNMFAIASP